MSRRILVTGAAGFIGSNFVHYWLKKNPSDFILAFDALTYAGNLMNLEAAYGKTNFKFCKGNICDNQLIENLIFENNINIIVHFAAESHVDRSISGPDKFIETNINGTYSLLKAAKKMWIDENFCAHEHRFHHVSTDEVYGSLGPTDSPFKEVTKYAPNSPYSASKASSDHLVRSYFHTYGLQVTTSNCSNNYGPFHFPEKLIPLVVTNILQNKSIPIYGDGKQIRDWLYVEDHVKGIELVLTKGILGEVYNIGGINEWTNIDIVRLVCELIDDEFSKSSNLMSIYPEAKMAIAGESNTLISHVADRPGHDWRYAIDPEKSKIELGYKPSHTFETGIAETIRWYLSNREWWTSILDGSYRLKKEI